MTGSAVRLGALRDAVRTQLWPVPALGVLLALGLGVLLPRVDARVDDDLPPALTGYLFDGGPGAAATSDVPGGRAVAIGVAAVLALAGVTLVVTTVLAGHTGSSAVWSEIGAA